MNPVGRLRDAMAGPSRPRGGDVHDLAKRVARVPEAELAVAEAALDNGGAVADRLLRQLRGAGDVWRLITRDGVYELRISTTDDLRIGGVPRSGWTSDWIPVAAASDAQPLELRVFVFEAGIVGLLGRTLDGRPWPRDWRARPGDLETIRAKAPWLRLPTPARIREARTSAAATIAAWLGNGVGLQGLRGVVRADPPANDQALVAFTAREAFALPEAYESLLRRADGIEVGRVVVLGTGDAYRLDMPGPARLVIAPPNEDGALTIAESGEVVWVELGAETTAGKVIAPELRQWLTKRLSTRRKATTRI
jgi:hypothetical protein